MQVIRRLDQGGIEAHNRPLVSNIGDPNSPNSQREMVSEMNKSKLDFLNSRHSPELPLWSLCLQVLSLPL